MSGLLYKLSAGAVRMRTSWYLLRNSAVNHPAFFSTNETPNGSKEKIRSFQPFWEPGSGYYGDTLGKIGRRNVEFGQEPILSHLDSVPVPFKKGVFTIGDYGTSDGYASMPLITNMIQKLRAKHGEELAIQVLYEDHEKNDFNSLFNRLNDKSSFLSKFNNVFTLAVGTDFYKQCVPDDTVDFIITSNAVQILSAGMTFDDGIAHVMPGVTEEEKRNFNQKAADMWQKFLLLRAKELKPGGVLAVLVPSAVSGYWEALQSPTLKPVRLGDSETNTPFTMCDFFLNQDASWREMRADNIITQDEYRDGTIPIVFRTDEEMTQPFTEVVSPVREAGLSLLFHDQIVVPCMFKTKWRESKQGGTDNWPAIAENLVTIVRITSESAFRSSLSGMRSEEEKQVIVDQLYERVLEKFKVADPDTLRTDVIISRLVAQKQI